MSRGAKALMLAAFAWFVFACLFALSGMGLSETESNVGVDTLKIFHRLRAFDFSLAGLPLMENYYVGALLRYMGVPFFFIFGDTVLALRLSALFYAAAFLFLVFAVVSRWFGRAAGLAVFVLLCINSTFIRSVRTGNEREEVLQLFFAWAFLWLCGRIAEGRRGYLYLCAFLVGLALWAKLMFAVFLVAMAAGLIVCGPAALKGAAKLLPRTKGEWAGTLALGALGILPLIVYNVKSGFATLRLAFAALSGPTELGWDNSAFLHNVYERGHDFYQLLTGRFDYIENIVNPYPLDYWCWCFLSAFAVLALHLVFGRKRFFDPRPLVFLLMMNAGVLVLLTYVPYGHSAEHVVVMLPLAEMLVVLALGTVVRFFRAGRSAALVLACLVLLPQVANETWITCRVLARARSGEVKTANSYAIAQAARYVAGQDDSLPLVAPDIVSYRLAFYSDLALRPVTYLNYWHPEDYDVRPPEDFCKTQIADFGAFRMVGLTFGQEKEYLAGLKTALAARGRKVELEEQFFGGVDTLERVEVYTVSGEGK